jgi:hypothetical protein
MKTRAGSDVGRQIKQEQEEKPVYEMQDLNLVSPSPALASASCPRSAQIAQRGRKKTGTAPIWQNREKEREREREREILQHQDFTRNTPRISQIHKKCPSTKP